MDMGMRFLNQLAGVHPFMLENFNLTDFPSQNLLTHNYTEFPASSTHILQSNHFLTGDACHESNKRKVMVQSNSCSQITSTSSSTLGNELEISYDTKRKKRKGNSENEVDNSEEVIHVRARRGQATDSHSLAERVRRQKISSKLKHLQDIVPGCYKSMGMAVMLDEIINYVYSLQSQVEFLSMELASSTSSYDFNQEIDAIIRRAST